MPPSTPNTDAIFEALIADRNNPAALRKRIETLELLLERSFTIPGINRPVGLDAIVGLVPVVGDVVTATPNCPATLLPSPVSFSPLPRTFSTSSSVMPLVILSKLALVTLLLTQAGTSRHRARASASRASGSVRDMGLPPGEDNTGRHGGLCGSIVPTP